jgi:beta-lactamase regulating signal transducer with metallopeptidase domain
VLSAAPLSQAATPAWGLSEAILGLWLGGVASTTALVAAAHWRTTRHMRRSQSVVPVELARLASDTARRLGLPRVPTLVLTESFGPAVCGVVRPRILLPASLVRNASRGQLATILAHELVHVRRKDLLVAWVQTAAQCVWWFHPLVWWASRAMSRERERCCDLEVVASGLCDRAEYAQCLVATARFHARVRLGLVPVGLTAFELTRRGWRRSCGWRREIGREPDGWRLRSPCWGHSWYFPAELSCGRQLQTTRPRRSQMQNSGKSETRGAHPGSRTW